MSALQSFMFDGEVVRVGGTPEAPTWVFVDVCRELGIKKHRDAYMRLAPDEKGRPVRVDTPGGAQELPTVTEPGLYRLIFRSNKPDAERFRRWVFHEVIPAIRQTGQYVAHDMVMVKKRAWEEHQNTVAVLSEAYELQAAASTKLASLAASMLAQRRHSKPKTDPRQGLIRFSQPPEAEDQGAGEGGAE